MSIEGLTSPVRDAVVEARGELAGRAELVGSAADVAELVPSLLADGRRYLLVIQNPGEPRGTGGFMGYFGTLEADGSRLQLTALKTAGSELVPPVHASADYVERWARFDGLIDLRQANFTPDVPTAAGVITQMTDELGGGTTTASSSWTRSGCPTCSRPQARSPRRDGTARSPPTTSWT